MREISCKFVVWVVEGARKIGVPDSVLFRGIEHRREEVMRLDNRADWNEFAGIVNRLAAHLDDPEKLREVGRHWKEFFPRQKITLAVIRAVGIKKMFSLDAKEKTSCTAIRKTFEDLGSDQCAFSTEVLPGFDLAPAMMHIGQGGYSVIGTPIGYPQVRVDTEPLPRGYRFIIHLPAGERSLFLRLRRWLAMSLGGQPLIEGLIDHRRDLDEGLRVYELLQTDFREFLEQVPLGIVAEQDGRIAFANRAFQSVAGPIDSSATSRPTIRELVSADDRALYDRLLATNSASSDGLTLRFQTNDSAVVHLRTVRVPTRKLNDRPTELYVMQDVTEQRRMELELTNAAADARRRLAQDLHDGLGQHLVAMRIRLKQLQETTGNCDPTTSGRFAELDEMVGEIKNHTRRMVRGLNWLVETDDSLPQSLELVIAESETRLKLAVTLEIDPAVEALDHDAVLHLCHIVEESLTNAVKHGRATTAKIILHAYGDLARLEISDNGSGKLGDLDPSKGMGLRIMRYRAAQVNGLITHKTVRNDGIVTEVLFPFRRLE